MVSKTRSIKIAERIREELSDLLVRSVDDPRLSGITITDVEIDRELAFANVYVSAVEGSPRSAEILAGLEHAQGFLRSELAHRIELRSFPRLRFRWDNTFEKADHMEKLFASLHHEEQSQKQSAQQDSNGLPKNTGQEKLDEGE